MIPPKYPQKGRPVEQTVREIIDYLKATTITSFVGGYMRQSRKGTTLSVDKNVRPRIQPPTKSPFYPELTGNESEGLLLNMLDGYVILRRNKGEDSMRTILPSDIPNETSVAVGDKITLKIEEDTEGEFTTASIVKTSGSWPESTAPDLSAESESGGVRHVRLCEIIKETDFPEVKIWSTGHVDHFAPTIISSADTTGSELLQKYDPATGKWVLKRLVAGEGITINETEDTLEIVADEAAPGAEGIFEWLFDDINDISNSSRLQLQFQNGKLVAAEGTEVNGDGTPGDPYQGTFRSLND